MNKAKSLESAKYLIRNTGVFGNRSVRCAEDGYVACWSMRYAKWRVEKAFKKNQKLVVSSSHTVIYSPHIKAAREVARELPSPFVWRETTLEGKYSGDELPENTFWPIFLGNDDADMI
ncbi:MAG: hypothetical protein KKA28_18785 [Planctomycetes bacterium]|nr:hypothetical protein [Planctomycetota bacterium]